MQNFRLCEKNILKSKRRSFQSNKKSNNLFKSFTKKNMVCQKRQFLRKIISQPLCKNANFSAKRLRGLTRETGGDTKGLQEVTRGYKRLQRVRRSWWGTRNMETNLPKKYKVKYKLTTSQNCKFFDHVKRTFL